VLYKNVVDSNAMLAAAIAHLNALNPRPDLVLVTGDLVDEGDPAEYAAVSRRLARCEIPYLVIPGNHDRREPFRAAFPGHAYLPSPAAPMHYVVEDYPVRIVAFDTTVPRLHHGEVTDAGLAWLADTLNADQGRPALIMMHHPPFACGIPYIDTYLCRDGERLAEIVARFPHVERVVCGHVHRPMLRRWGGTAICTSPSTATQIALQLDPGAAPASYCEPPACLLHWWSPDAGMVTHTSYIGRFEGPFPFA
jgi:3',5'-cyclic AMP phosphodiesterase CpdA